MATNDWLSISAYSFISSLSRFWRGSESGPGSRWDQAQHRGQALHHLHARLHVQVRHSFNYVKEQIQLILRARSMLQGMHRLFLCFMPRNISITVPFFSINPSVPHSTPKVRFWTSFRPCKTCFAGTRIVGLDTCKQQSSSPASLTSKLYPNIFRSTYPKTNLLEVKFLLLVNLFWLASQIRRKWGLDSVKDLTFLSNLSLV